VFDDDDDPAVNAAKQACNTINRRSRKNRCDQEKIPRDPMMFLAIQSAVSQNYQTQQATYETPMVYDGFE
jgi:hypothetical protein